jgi:hemerythrin-like metal-binding protein
MIPLEWSHELSIGNNEIDEQHRELMNLLNTLQSSALEGADQAHLEKELEKLISHTALHFQEEERAMRAVGYPDVDRHTREHESLEGVALNFQRQFSEYRISLDDFLMRFLRNWLTEHIRTLDTDFGTYLTGKNVQ